MGWKEVESSRSDENDVLVIGRRGK